MVNWGFVVGVKEQGGRVWLGARFLLRLVM